MFASTLLCLHHADSHVQRWQLLLVFQRLCSYAPYAPLQYCWIQSTLKRQTCITSCFYAHVQPAHPFSFMFCFCKLSQWHETPWATVLPSETRKDTWLLRYMVQSKVQRWNSWPVFFPALLQLQDVYFRPFHKYKASQLTGISTVGKGGSSKGDGSGMRFLGVKSSCLKTVKTSMM